MEKKGLLLVLATALISGVSVFLNRFGVSGMDPGVFTTMKNVLVALLLLATVLALKEWDAFRKLSKKEWSLLALIGLLGGSIPFVLFFTGLKLTTAAQGSFLQRSMFLWVGIIAFFALKERVDWRIITGALLLLTGNALILKLYGYTFARGDLFILAATLFWAVEIVLSKRVLTGALTGKMVALGRMGFGALFLLLYLVLVEKLSIVPTLSQQSWIWILVTAVFLYGYVITFYEGLKTIPATVATAILLLGSVVTTLLELAWTGSVAWPQLIGSALLIAGAALVVDLREVLVHRRSET